MTRNRAIETRENEMRNDYHMFHTSPLAVPLEVYEPEKFAYHWSRLIVKGEEDSRVETLLRQGWELIPRLKESNVDLDPLGRNPNSKKYYMWKGNILMRLEKKIYEERTKNRTKEHDNKLKNISIATNDASSQLKSSGLTSF